jgi:hypothetical protein
MNTAARQLPADPVSSLVGRDEAVARVLASVQPPYVDALAVLIEGPAGIGKTSLLRAGVAKAEAAGATVLYARPVETEATYAYATLGDPLGPDLASIDVRLAEVHRAVLRRALGNDDGPRPADAVVEEAPDAQRVAIAVLAAFRALAARGALLIAIDDAPWADPASRDALAFSMRRLAGVPVRLLIAQRSDKPGEPPPFGLAEAARPIPVERLWLEPLSMGALINCCAPRPTPASRGRRSCASRNSRAATRSTLSNSHAPLWGRARPSARGRTCLCRRRSVVWWGPIWPACPHRRDGSCSTWRSARSRRWPYWRR